MSGAVGYSLNQRRVLAELGLASLRLRAAGAPVVADDSLLLMSTSADDPLLMAIIALMPDGTVSREGSVVRLRLRAVADDELGSSLDLAVLRRRALLKRRLWERQRRLRRGGGG